MTGRSTLGMSITLCNPTNWVVNLGDSPSNDGGGGDATQFSNDAEIQIFMPTGLTIYSNQMVIRWEHRRACSRIHVRTGFGVHHLDVAACRSELRVARPDAHGDVAVPVAAEPTNRPRRGSGCVVVFRVRSDDRLGITHRNRSDDRNVLSSIALSSRASRALRGRSRRRIRRSCRRRSVASRPARARARGSRAPKGIAYRARRRSACPRNRRAP